MISNKKYFPTTKTTIAEMRCLKNLSDHVKDGIVPVFELTKSRKTKNDKDGDVYKRIKEIYDIFEQREFVLDITNEQALTNPQIESFFDDFDNWVDFVKEISNIYNCNVIPTILLFEDSTREEITDLYHALKTVSGSGKVCLKIDMPSFYNERNQETLHTIIDVSKELDDDIIIINTGFIDHNGGEMHWKLKQCQDVLRLIDKESNNLVVFTVSTFPKSMLDSASKEKEFENPEHKKCGEVSFQSFKIYETLRREFEYIHYGDYACIHPHRNEAKAFKWVPRIDYPFSQKIFYFRTDAGYAACARELVNKYKDIKEDKLKCWGRDEVFSAASGAPGGLSPSYWISVRSNIHITRMHALVK
ncbi:beta family protein [Aeromonas sobria]|uniref:beta family protein n=1 Tax=Aeromonas sobria TaxID=646 RepID=UPI001115D534|nr:hypothetical protein [Aeromonas sobria]TNH81548.1 hypothetical protein CF140_13545 [Aeromonas sobria]